MPVDEVREIYLSQNSMHTFIDAIVVANMIVYASTGRTVDLPWGPLPIEAGPVP